MVEDTCATMETHQLTPFTDIFLTGQLAASHTESQTETNFNGGEN